MSRISPYPLSYCCDDRPMIKTFDRRLGVGPSYYTSNLQIKCVHVASLPLWPGRMFVKAKATSGRGFQAKPGRAQHMFMFI
jgi:hypothetical protein